DQDHFGLRNVAPRVRAAIDAEDLLRRGRGRHHAQAPVVVDVARAQRDARELAREVGALVRDRRAGEHGERVVAVLLLDALDLARGAIERGIPFDRAEAFTFDALERREQPIGMLVLHVALDAFRAEHAAVERELFPRLEADDLVVLDLELDAALLSAEAAVRL